MKTPEKLALLGSLYFSQGLPFGFFTVAVPAMLRARGVELHLVGLANLLSLPWALKFLWAPLVDRHGSSRFGHRKSWIVPLQIASVLTVMAVSFVDPATGIPALMAGLFLTNLIAATQDIATDGFAVELLDEKERGHGNGIQVAGYRVGMVLGGGALLSAFARAGWSATFVIMASLLAAATLPILLHRERAAPPRPKEAKPGSMAWVDVVRRPGWGVWLAVLCVYKSGEAMAAAMVKPLFVDRGLSLEVIGWLTGAGGSVAGLTGALLGGWAVSRFGRRRALLGCGLLQVIGVIIYIIPAAGLWGTAAFAFATLFEHVVGGMATVALFTLMMDACGEGMAGTEYTLQASVYVVATGVAATLSGYVARAVGYPIHFALSAAIGAVGLALTAFAFARGVVPPPAAAPAKAAG